MAQHSNGWVYWSLAHEIFTKPHGNSVSWEKNLIGKVQNTEKTSMFDIFWSIGHILELIILNNLAQHSNSWV